MNILIFGASGMVGQGVLRECLVNGRVTAVSSVVRTPTGRTGPKLTEIIVPDMFAIAPEGARLGGFDACFFCLGTSSVGMSEADYTRVTYDLTMTVAQELAPRNPAMTFIYVTGASTDRDSRQMWARVKARTEDALAALPFRAAYAFRPGFMQPLHGVVPKSRWVRPIFAATRALSPWLMRRYPAFATTTERVGRAMIAVAAGGYPTAVLESVDINRAGA